MAQKRAEDVCVCVVCISEDVCMCYLHKNRSSFVHVPQELCRIKLGGVSLRLHNAH